jgi:cob(I)alamin adenosyltransferase
MVKLDRIYTGGGDTGETSLGDGSRLPKSSLRVHAIGEVDEANATLGLVRIEAEESQKGLVAMLARIQNDLFDLGADLARPGGEPDDGNLRIQAVQVARLEGEIDELNERLEPLTSFVLAGGTELAGRLHISRTVIRRAERAVVALAALEPVNAQALTYLNRLSDLMFVMGRAANDQGRLDILWQPGLTTNQ